MGLPFVVSSVLLYFVALQMLIQACNGCPEKERIGLLEIKAHFIARSNDFAVSELSSWVDDRASNCCSWNRIKCTNITTGHVTELDLSGLEPYSYTEKTSLMFNVSLFRPFEELLSLDLFGNYYEGWIHNEGFPRLTKLESLNLSANSLNSSILSSLNGLTSLKTLNLGYNSMNSFSAQGFSRLMKLESLDLSANSLNSSILSSLNGLTSLKTLNLGSNSINSFSVQGFPRLTKLESLDLSANSLNSSILSSLNGLTSLKTLTLRYNSMNSFSVQGFSRLMKLESLDLSDNSLNSSILSSLNGLTSLKTLNLRNNSMNSFSGQGIQILRSLKVLDLSHNKLVGSLEEKSTQVNLPTHTWRAKEVDVSNMLRMRRIELSLFFNKLFAG